MQRVRIRTKPRAEDYEVVIGQGTLEMLGRLARRKLPPSARRIVLISNKRVFSLYGESASRHLSSAGYIVAPWLMGDGERFKTLNTLERALGFCARAGLERSDAIVALGGGVVGDLSGFAAAVYLRGIPFIQVPTTLLAQVDASVGGKTAVNTTTGKNLVGAFHHPSAVVIDVNTLETLPLREMTAGLCECIKQGAAGSRELFNRTYEFISKRGVGKDNKRDKRLERLIAAQVVFKASVVAGDEREELSRTDASSRRILNFGHTVGHALEAVTGYRRLLHGEAVGYGMLVAGEISRRLGLLDTSELELLRDAIRSCGRLPPLRHVQIDDVLGRIAHDKKSVAGHLKWVLLERIGRARIVDGSKLPQPLMRASLRAVIDGI